MSALKLRLPYLLGALVLLVSRVALAQPQLAQAAQQKPTRSLKIVVAADAPEAVRRAAQQVLDACNAPASPKLLSVLATGKPPGGLSDSAQLLAGDVAERAYSHLIMIGLPTDPMIAAAWQRESRPTTEGFTIFGWGHLRGDIGEIESDRNPFLHSAAIATAPFETEVITLTGNTPAGVALAVNAFLRKGLINGAVAAPGWTRPQTTLLDQDPLEPNFPLPAWVPASSAEADLIGLSAGGEDEYRGVLADTETEPLEIWRAKYYVNGAWDGVGALGAFENYSFGLHRRAYGNTLWMARFASAQQAAQVAPRIAGAAKLNQKGDSWIGVQPPYADGKYLGDKPSSGALRLWQRGEWILMSTLSTSQTDALVAQTRAIP